MQSRESTVARTKIKTRKPGTRQSKHSLPSLMKQITEFIESFQNDMVKKEKIAHSLNVLNKHIESLNDFILYVHIRGLNANYNKLQVFI